MGRENTYISNRDLVPREPAIHVLQSSRGTTTDSNSADEAFAPNGAPDAAAENPHVALFLPSLVSGGAERVMLHIAEGLAQHGASVDLVLSSVEGDYVSQVPANVRVVDLGCSRVISSLPSLIRYLRRERPTALLSALAHANLVAIWASLLARTDTRVVVAVHSTLSHSTRFSPRRRDRLVPWLSRLFYRKAARVVAVSRGSAQDLIELTDIDKDLVEVIPNPVISDRLMEAAKEPVDLPWLNGDPKPVLITVGRLTAAKNHPLLLRAFSRLRAERDANLIILGDGEERTRLEELIRELGLHDQVKMLGYVENPWAYMSKADVFVLSSKWEGLPTVIVEALALGMRVVSTDCEYGPRELLKDGRYGTLVPVEDVEALSAGILAALDSDPPRVDMADLDAFRLDSAAKRYRDLLLN